VGDALTDCGPCDHGGAPVRTRLAVWWLPASLRAFCLVRLAHGERHYGAPLREGWEPAEVELRQEVADAVAYAFAARRPGLVFVLSLVWRLL